MSKIIKAFAVYGQDGDEPLPMFTIKPKEIAVDDFIEGVPQEEPVNASPSSIIEHAKAEAKRIVDDANAQSVAYIKTTTDRIDAEFQANVQRGFEQGFERGVEDGKRHGNEQGYKQGYDDGINEADIEAKHNLTIMQNIIEGIDEARHMMLKKYENNLSDVALSMARTLVRKELEINPKQLNRIIEDAASACKNQEYILVTLSQAGYDLITLNDDSVKNILSTYSDDVRFFIDRNMTDSDCIIETPIGVIDASIKVQLDNIEGALKSMDNQEN